MVRYSSPKDLIFIHILSNRVEEANQLADECNPLIVDSLTTSLSLLKSWEDRRSISNSDANYFAGELAGSARQYRRDCVVRTKQIERG